jgi:protein CpxP
MKKETLLTVVVVTLLFINAGTLSFLFLHHGEEKIVAVGNRPDTLIISGLRLDSLQVARYKNMKHEHAYSIMEVDHRERLVQLEFFELLKNNKPDRAKLDEVFWELSEFKQQKDRITFMHFHKIRKLCSKDQRVVFDSLINEIALALMKPSYIQEPM